MSRETLNSYAARASGLTPVTHYWNVNSEQVKSLLKFNTKEEILYRGVSFSEDSDFIRSFYKYNKVPLLKGNLSSFSSSYDIVLEWLTSQKCSSRRSRKSREEKQEYKFIISTVLPIGFPMYDTRIMKIGNTMEEVALPNKYMNKYLTLNLLSVKHLSLSSWEKAKLKLEDCEIPENTYILNCVLTYESAPFEESKFSKEWINWDTRYTEFYSKIKANLNDLSKENVVGVSKMYYDILTEFKFDSGDSCSFEKGHDYDGDGEYIYLSVYNKGKSGDKETFQKCKELSGLSGWYDLHKDL